MMCGLTSVTCVQMPCIGAKSCQSSVVAKTALSAIFTFTDTSFPTCSAPIFLIGVALVLERGLKAISNRRNSSGGMSGALSVGWSGTYKVRAMACQGKLHMATGLQLTTAPSASLLVPCCLCTRCHRLRTSHSQYAHKTCLPVTSCKS